jgi:hypothetical protein
MQPASGKGGVEPGADARSTLSARAAAPVVRHAPLRPPRAQVLPASRRSMSGEDAMDVDKNDGAGGSAQGEKRFVVKKWSAVSLWAWGACACVPQSRARQRRAALRARQPAQPLARARARALTTPRARAG